MSQVKGSLVISRMKYINQKATPDQKEKILALLTPDYQYQLQNQLLAGRWFPIQLFIDLHLAIDTILGKGDKILLHDIARFSAEDALNGIYKLFYKIGSPEFIIKRAASVWRQFYSSGSIEVTIPEPDKAIFKIINYDKLKEEHCLIIQSWMEKTLEMSGGNQPMVTFTKTNDSCVFTGTWN